MTASLIPIVNWMAEITGAEVEGNELQSQTLTFRPKHRPSPKLLKKEIKIDSGSMTASACLFLQTMLPVLLMVGGDLKRDKSIELRIEGATNCVSAPSYEYLDQIFFPALETYFGIKSARQLTRRGWSQMTADARTVQKGTVRVKFMPLDWESTLKACNDAKLYEEDTKDATGGSSDTEASHAVGPRSVDNNILNIVATIITPAAMHDPLREALTEDLETRFPDAKIEFDSKESGHTDRVYVILVAKAKHCRWSRDYVNSDRLKDVNVVSLAKEISSQLANGLEDESNGDCPIDSFLQDQLVIYQALAEGRSSFPRARKDQTMEVALANLHLDAPLKEDSLSTMTLRNATTSDSQHTQLARYAAAMMLSDAKFYNDGKVCIGAGFKTGPPLVTGRNRKLLA